MKRLAILVVVLSGCEKASPPAVVEVQSAASDGHEARIAELEDRIAELEQTPEPAIQSLPLESRSEAAAIVGRLSQYDRLELAKYLRRLNADAPFSKLEYESFSRITGGRSDAMIGVRAIPKMRESQSPGMRWAAKNLSAQQAGRVWIAREEIGGVLDKFVTGQKLPAMQMNALESVIGTHAEFDAHALRNADPDLVKEFEIALKQSERAE